MMSANWVDGILGAVSNAHSEGATVEQVLESVREAMECFDGWTQSDDDLPGMWSYSDFTGGETEAVDPDRQRDIALDDKMGI